MKKILLIANWIFFLILFAACSNNATTDSKKIAAKENDAKFDSSGSRKDADFVVEAADGGMLEVELGKLASKNGMSSSVKDFGQMMVDDHSKANTELKTMAGQMNVTVPAALSTKSQKKYDDLATKSGKDFDKDYISLMVDDHEADIKEFKDEAEKGSSADLKAWASGKLPVLEHHLSVAKSIKDSLKK